MRKHNLGWWGCSAITALVVAVCLGYWWLFQTLWNAVAVGIFHTPYHLTYVQAALLATLLGLIGGMFGKAASK